jgi:acylpyruvate hydrolase
MKIICIGRNYAEHAKELHNPIPAEPMVFMKPPTALLVNDKPFFYPDFTRDLHYEGEIVLKISKNGRHVRPEFASSYFQEIGLGIDFTARDLQESCKKKGQPWEIAKAFDHSAPLGRFLPLEAFDLAQGIAFELRKNGQTVQRGNTRDMLFSFVDIIVYVSRFFKLQTGDLLFTGTPAGVGPALPGDHLEGWIYDKHGRAIKSLDCQVR